MRAENAPESGEGFRGRVKGQGFLFLAAGAENAAPAAEDDAPQRFPARGAGHTRLAVNLQIRRVAVFLSLAEEVIFKGNFVLSDKEIQPFGDGFCKAREFALCQRVAGLIGADVCGKENFVGIDVADARHDALIEQHRLYGFFAVFAAVFKIERGERGVERLDAQRRDAAAIFLAVF